MKNNPYYVNISSHTPGDVIFWEQDVTKNDKKYWLSVHVGIYIGNGQSVPTSFDTKKVAIDNYQWYVSRWNAVLCKMVTYLRRFLFTSYFFLSWNLIQVFPANLCI
jgi:hypothetical protein